MTIKAITIECDHCGDSIDPNGTNNLTVTTSASDPNDFCNFSHLKLWLETSHDKVITELENKAPQITNILQELEKVHARLNTLQVPEVEPEPKEFFTNFIMVDEVTGEEVPVELTNEEFHPHPPIKTQFVNH